MVEGSVEWVCFFFFWFVFVIHIIENNFVSLSRISVFPLTVIIIIGTQKDAQVCIGWAFIASMPHLSIDQLACLN